MQSIANYPLFFTFYPGFQILENELCYYIYELKIGLRIYGREERIMREILARAFTSQGRKICAIVVSLASIAPLCCRASWYQPKEPKGLEEFLW